MFTDDPARERLIEILAELASWGTKARLLTGGRWERQEWSKQTTTLVGWLKLPDKDASILSQNSGSRGIFVNQNIEDVLGSLLLCLPAPIVGKVEIQAEQTWVCPLCEIEIYEKPGPRARKLFRAKRRSHLIARHTAEERRQVPRFGAATQLIVPRNRSLKLNGLGLVMSVV